MRISKNILILGILFTSVLFKAFSQPGELYGCCCLMPTAGCLIGMAMRRDTVKERIAKERWEKIKDLPWYRKLSFGIGYSGGVCYTGEDLMKYTDWDPLAWANPTYWTYWLNSIEVSVTYPMSWKWGIEVGMGYGWARIQPSEYVDWRFRMPILFLGYKLSKLSIKGRYMFIYAKDNIQSSIEEQHGRGNGNGLSVLLEYSINKHIGILLSLGNGKYHVRRYYKEDYQDRVSEYNVDICFNAIGLSLMYNFNLKGGVK